MSDSNRVSLSWTEEATWGVLPGATALQNLNFTSESFAFNLTNTQSENIRSDRNIADLIQNGADCSGGFNFEFQASNIDNFLQGALWASAWTTRIIADAAITIGATNVDDTYTHTGAPGWDTLLEVGQWILVSGYVNGANNGYFAITGVTPTTIVVGAGGTLVDEAATPAVTIKTFAQANDVTVDETASVYTYTSAALIDWTKQDLTVGQWIKVAGFTTAGNNGFCQVRSITATILTVVGLTLTDEIAGDTVTFSPCDFIKNGTTENSYYFERAHADITQFFQFAGMVPNSLSMTASANAIMTGSLEFIGKDATLTQATAGTGSNTAAVATPIMNAVSNVGQVMVDNVVVTSCLVQEISFTLNNNVRGLSSIGTLGNCDIGVGSVEVTGNLNAYFKDETFYDRYLAATAFALSFKVEDASNNAYIVSFGNCKIESDAINATGINTDVMENMSFRAILDSTYTNAAIEISRILA